MICSHGRIIRPEWLDEQSPEAAAPSLHDLVLINRLLGGHEVLRKTMRDLVRADQAFTFLDVGAASGDMGRALRERYALARVTSLDYKEDHLHRAGAPRVCGDAFRLPFLDAAFDFVHCSLFLHHFTNEQAVVLLREFGRVSGRAVIVTDLERHPLAYHFLPATRWLFGWDRITLHDGPISVEAAFHKEELEALGRAAGLKNLRVACYRPAFRLAMVASPASRAEKIDTKQPRTAL
ncbi:MAG TPA: methyltransferase domain-containing protein [Bryobacteraceae bacterium]|nr:methyltransferase domain-containing protein [Bryobacteraceae bacterium]